MNKFLIYSQYLCSAYLIGFGTSILIKQIQTSITYAGVVTLMYGITAGLITLRYQIRKR